MNVATQEAKLSHFRMRILAVLSQHPNVNITSLARKVGCSRPSLSRVMPVLEKQDFVKCHDRVWSVTEHGRTTLEKRAVYERYIEPLLHRATDLANLHDIPFLAVCEVEGWLKIHKHALSSCSELACAYHELAGWGESL
jgi:DNA-binding MarR family transcriptional regulator